MYYPDSDLTGQLIRSIDLKTLYLIQIRKKRQQGGVYNPQEMENKDYKRKGNIDINSISMQVQPERLIWSNDFHGKFVVYTFVQEILICIYCKYKNWFNQPQFFVE